LNEILSVGLILMAALIAGHAAQLIRVPEVTGYLLVGLLIGPTALDLISHDNLEALGFLSEVALGLILFSIGSIFEASQFRRLGRGVVRITLFETSCSFVLVAIGVWAAGQPVAVALLLGVVAMETAPATTLMVLHEYDAEGPLTDRLLALLAMNNVFVLVSFGVVSAALTLVLGAEAAPFALGYRAAYGLAWTTVGSVALGILLGLFMDLWAGRARESGEAMILAIGVILVAVGAARWLGLSPLISTLALGALVANASHHGRVLLEATGKADPPLYAAFFVLAGAELQLGSLAGLGMAGGLYVVMRTVGKLGGARLGMSGQKLPPAVRRNLGLCLISSSSLAVGLTIQIRSSFPEFAAAVTGIVLAAVLIFEIAGPLLARQALLRAGEARTSPQPLEPLPDVKASA
jgi:Kef-type K+ transport system membrane component KefB